jgi:16S rRNA (guanine1207-N2)-methyltransferase
MIAKNLDALRSDIVFKSNLKGFDMVFHSTWGLFSPRSVDEGSMMLIEEMNVSSSDTVLDLGCGYGVIGLTAARLASKGKVHLVDKDFVAVDFARKNAQLNKITNTDVYLSNGFSAVPNIQFDVIVSNLPAKVGDEMITILLEDAKSHLKTGGRLYVVTISGLREYIKRNFKEVFGNYDKLKQGKTYTVAVAVKE